MGDRRRTLDATACDLINAIAAALHALFFVYAMTADNSDCQAIS